MGPSPIEPGGVQPVTEASRTDSSNDLPDEALVAIRFVGRGLGPGAVTSATLCRYLEAFRLSLQSAVESVESIKRPEKVGRRKRWIERLTDLPVVGFDPSENRLLLGKPPRQGLFCSDDEAVLCQALDLVFRSLVAASQPTPAWQVSPGDQRSGEMSPPALLLAARLVPPHRGQVESISYACRVPGDTVRFVEVVLDRGSRARVGGAGVTCRIPDPGTSADDESLGEDAK